LLQRSFMADALAASIVDALLSLQLGATSKDISNRVSLDGLTLNAGTDGALMLGLRRFEATSLRFASGPLVLEIGRLASHQLLGQVRLVQGRPRLYSLQATDAEFSDVKVHGPLILPRPSGSASTDSAVGEWSLSPLAAADGSIRAKIVDAHLLFDADVTVPIRHGQIDFNEVTVEHVGPDSRMGVSRLGVYVDAPNGRSYLYQFASTPISGVEFEQRNALIGVWVTDRGKLQLEPFGEGMLRQGRRGPGMGFTDQARLLFDRTALSGDVQLGDGRFAAPGVEAHLVGRANGRNAIRVHSEAVGRGLAVDLPSLSVRHALLSAKDTRLACDEITGRLMLRVFVEGTQLRFAFSVPQMKMSGLRVDTTQPRSM
jgi:hypothetical protein